MGTLRVPEELHRIMLYTLHDTVRPLHEVRQVLEELLHELRQVFELLQHRMWPTLPQTTWMRLYLPVYRLRGWPDMSLLPLQLRVGSLHQDAEERQYWWNSKMAAPKMQDMKKTMQDMNKTSNSEKIQALEAEIERLKKAESDFD